MAKQRSQKHPISNNASAAANVEAVPSENKGWTALLIVLAITFLAFTSSLSNKFVNWDDDVNIVENENTEILDWVHVKAIFTSDVIGNYNPLPILTLAIERHFVGLEGTWLYHWTNLFLHLFCVFFAFRITRALGLSIWASAFCAVLFGIHPLRVESVAWVTERKDVLFAAFYLPAFYLYIKYVKEEENRRKLYVYMLILFVFSLLSKVQAVALPLSMLAYDYYARRVNLNDIKGLFNMVVEKIPFFLLSLASGLTNVYFLSKNSSIGIGMDDDITHFTFLDRLAIGGYSFMVYLMKLIFPYEMSPLYPYPQALDWTFYILAPIGVAAVFYAMYKIYQSDNRAIVFGFLFFFLNVVFMLQIVGAGQGFLADRFTYIPYFGCFFITAYLFDRVISSQESSYKTFAYGLAGIFVLMFSLMTFQQNKIWENGATLWTHVLKYYTNSEMALGNKARYQREVLKDYKAALENFSKSLSIKQKPETHNGRGKTYFDMGNGTELTQKAIADYTAALALPSLAKLEKKAIGEIYANRGAAYGRLSEEAKDRNYLSLALADINKSVEYDAKNKNSYLNGYLICSQLGNPQGAIENIDKYIALSPYEADMYYSRGMENRRLNNLPAALKDFNDALIYAPNDIKRAKSSAERAEKTKNTAYYYLERARTYVAMGNLNAAKMDLASLKGVGEQVPPDMKAYE